MKYTFYFDTTKISIYRMIFLTILPIAFIIGAIHVKIIVVLMALSVGYYVFRHAKHSYRSLIMSGNHLIIESNFKGDSLDLFYQEILKIVLYSDSYTIKLKSGKEIIIPCIRSSQRHEFIQKIKEKNVEISEDFAAGDAI